MPRWMKRLAPTLGLALCVGCSSTEKNNQPNGLPMTGLMSSKSKPVTPMDGNINNEVRLPRVKPGTPLKPETEVAFAETEMQAAYAEGRTASERDQLLDDARQRYQKALKTDPKNAAGLLGLARMYGKSGDAAHAVSTYRQYLEYHPNDHKVAHELAAVYYKADDFTNAVAACEFALKADPENKQYTKTMGLAVARSGRYDEGLAIMAKVMSETSARYYLARTMEHNGDTELVKQQLQLVLKADPTYPGAKEYLAYMNGEAPANPVQQAGATDGN